MICPTCRKDVPRGHIRCWACGGTVAGRIRRPVHRGRVAPAIGIVLAVFSLGWWLGAYVSDVEGPDPSGAWVEGAAVALTEQLALAPSVSRAWSGPADWRTALTHPQTVAGHAILIDNTEGGGVFVSEGPRGDWLRVGAVRIPVTEASEGWAASQWSRPGAVAAVATHGVRVATADRASDGRAMTFSVIPAEFAVPPDGYSGYLAGTSGIYTDIPAGESIFGASAPLVGSPVHRVTKGGLAALQIGEQPAEGERYVISVALPRADLASITLENRRNGEVRAQMADGRIVKLAQVRRPVCGIGRFDATEFTGCGGVNTNHAGVITVSTAPRVARGRSDSSIDLRGGFMIQPDRHAAAERGPYYQVMVVEPLPDHPPLEGQAPLFSGFLRPWDGHAGAVVDVRVGGQWMPLDVGCGRAPGFFVPTGGGDGTAEPWAEAFRIRLIAD